MQQAITSAGFHRVLSLFRVAMDFVENIRVCQERAETGFGAEIDRPAAVLNAREIGWIGITEAPSTEGDETGVFLLVGRALNHNQKVL